MQDEDVFARIHQLIDEEHELRRRAVGERADPRDAARLQALEAALDQCWDLLRQRRARREVGQNPDEATVRPATEVEGYQQ